MSPYRLPPNFSSTGDPIDGNPFPAQDPRQKVWGEATRKAEEEVARINAAELLFFGERRPTDEPLDVQVKADVERFDAWARRYLEVVWSDGEMSAYDAWLFTYANARIDVVVQFHKAAPDGVSVSSALTNLRNLLGGRVQHWKAEARRLLAEQERYRAQRQGPFKRPSTVSLDVKKRRKSRLKKHRKDNRLTAERFALGLGLSKSTIWGIVNEDQSRFDEYGQQKLVDALGVSLPEWYEA